jgi:hypothetical protein
MSGNAANTALWDGADVFVSFDLDVTGPDDLTTPWTGFEVVGLLDGEEGFTHGREEESSEHYAWGGILYKRTKGKHKRTVSFVALEDNDTTFRLVNPGSTRTAAGGVRTSTIKVPTTESFVIGQEIREAGTGKVKRRYAKRAEVQEVGEIKESESEPTVFEVTVVIFPEEDGTIWHEVETDPATAV